VLRPLLCSGQCDIVLGCSPPLNGDVSYSHFAEGDNLDSKKVARGRGGGGGGGGGDMKRS
jgi:hypothetical protein